MAAVENKVWVIVKRLSDGQYIFGGAHTYNSETQAKRYAPLQARGWFKDRVHLLEVDFTDPDNLKVRWRDDILKGDK